MSRTLGAFAQPYERLLEIVSASLSLSAYLQTPGEKPRKRRLATPVKDALHFLEPLRGQERSEMCQTVRQMRFFTGWHMSLIAPLHDMHGPFSDLNASPQSESVMMTVLQNGWMKLLTCQTEFSRYQTPLFFPHIFILCHHSF